MRIRSIKPEFWSHEKMSAVPADAALLAIGLLNYCDDEGFFNAHPKLVQAALFPLRETSITVPVILTELSRIGYIAVHTDSDGRQTGHVLNFSDHQVISHPKKSVLRPLYEASGIVPGSLPETNGNHTGGLLSGMEGNGREQGTGKGTGNARPRGKGRKTGINPADLSEPIGERLFAIGTLLHRQENTIWTHEEFEAFQAAGLEQLTPEDFLSQFTPLRGYYGATIPREKDFRRRDVLRLVRHWPGELDRARAWVRDHDDGLKKM